MKRLAMIEMAAGLTILLAPAALCGLTVDESVRQNAATSRPATASVTFHVLGMKKTKSGAT